MGYRLQPNEPVTDGVKRVVFGEIDMAGAMLLQDGDERDKGVHEARKSFKKIRAVLRLVRPALGAAYDRENAWFRDVARELSDLRDAQAVLESLDKLQNAFSDETDADAFADIRLALEQRRNSIADNNRAIAANVERVRANLEEVRQRVEAWKFKRTGFAAIGPGLLTTYRRGRDARAGTLRSPSNEAFHEWRKSVKYHWYHVRLLQDLWPKMLKPTRALLKDLAEVLGDDHDLVVLKQTILEVHPDLRHGTASGAPSALLDQRQKQLRAAARSLGDRIYAEKPTCLAGRFHGYWRIWRGEA